MILKPTIAEEQRVRPRVFPSFSFYAVRLDYSIFLTCSLSGVRFGSKITNRKQNRSLVCLTMWQGNGIFSFSLQCPGATLWICNTCLTRRRKKIGAVTVTTLSKINESWTMKPTQFYQIKSHHNILVCFLRFPKWQNIYGTFQSFFNYSLPFFKLCCHSFFLDIFLLFYCHLTCIVSYHWYYFL